MYHVRVYYRYLPAFCLLPLSREHLKGCHKNTSDSKSLAANLTQSFNWGCGERERRYCGIPAVFQTSRVFFLFRRGCTEMFVLVPGT